MKYLNRSKKKVLNEQHYFLENYSPQMTGCHWHTDTEYHTFLKYMTFRAIRAGTSMKEWRSIKTKCGVTFRRCCSENEIGLSRCTISSNSKRIRHFDDRWILRFVSFYTGPVVPRGRCQHMVIHLLILHLHLLQTSIGPIRAMQLTQSSSGIGWHNWGQKGATLVPGSSTVQYNQLKMCTQTVLEPR